MDDNMTNPTVPILDVAWRRFAELDSKAENIQNAYYRLRRWVYILGFVATLLAILVDLFGEGMYVLADLALKVLLVLAPIAASGIAAFTNRFFQGSSWLAARAGAEEILKEIYTYRTIMQKSPERSKWLERRLANIQRQIFRSLGGEMVLKTYTGKIPPYYQPEDANSDPGFSDLTLEEYVRFRLENQLAWHIKKVNQNQRDRSRMQIFILLFGGAGALLAGLGGGLSIWVALTASVVAALSGWEELRNLDVVIKNYSKVIVELMILYDHWRNLEPEERGDYEFFRIVRATEDLMWAQNMEYIKSMQDALAAVEDEDARLVEGMIQKSIQQDAQFKQQIRQSILDQAEGQMETVYESAAETFDHTVGTLSEQATSEEARLEMAAATQYVKDKFGTMRNALSTIKEKYADVEVTKETEKELLNRILNEYPTTGELKG